MLRWPNIKLLSGLEITVASRNISGEIYLKVLKSRSNYCTLCISPQIKDGFHCGIREEAHDSIYAFYHGCTRTSQKDNQVRKNHFIRNVQNVILGSNLLGNGFSMAQKNKLGILISKIFNKNKFHFSPKLTVAEIGKKWKSLNAKQKSVWEKKSMTEVNKAKIMNKGAVQRCIQAPIEVSMIFTYKL